MGCVSSKQVKKELVREIRVNNGGDHIVSLTSTTYGHLDLDERAEPSPKLQEITKGDVFESEVKPRRSTTQRDDPEIINTWELMEDLEDSMHPQRISPKSSGIFGKSWKTPVKSIVESPERNSSKRLENRGANNSRGVSPNQILEPKKFFRNSHERRNAFEFPSQIGRTFGDDYAEEDEFQPKIKQSF